MNIPDNCHRQLNMHHISLLDEYVFEFMANDMNSLLLKNLAFEYFL